MVRRITFFLLVIFLKQKTPKTTKGVKNIAIPGIKYTFRSRTPESKLTRMVCRSSATKGLGRNKMLGCLSNRLSDLI